MGAPAALVRQSIRLTVALWVTACSAAQPPVPTPRSPTLADLRARTARLLRRRVDTEWLALIGRSPPPQPEPKHDGDAEQDLAIVRAAISQQRTATPRSLSYLHSFLIGAAHDGASAVSLGYRHELDLARDLLHFDPRRVVTLAEALLRASAALTLGSHASGGRRASDPDSNYDSTTSAPGPDGNAEVFVMGVTGGETGTDADAELSADRLLPALRQTVAGIGMNLAAPPLAVFVAAPAATRPVADCFALDVPDEVRLYIGTATGGPAPGREGYRAALAAVGRCLSLVHAPAEPFELWRLGDQTRTASFALLFASLVDDPQWLADVVGIEEPQLTQLAHRGARARLERARADARLVVTGMGVGGDLSAVPDRPSLFAAARRLRARVLAASLRAILIATSERRWWRAADAGDVLRELWAREGAMTGEELATASGVGELRPEALLTEIARAMARIPPP